MGSPHLKQAAESRPMKTPTGKDQQGAPKLTSGHRPRGKLQRGGVQSKIWLQKFSRLTNAANVSSTAVYMAGGA